MDENSGPHCGKCGYPLALRDDEIFAGTVFAVDAHDCARVIKVVGEARRGAGLFATLPEFTHARLITAGLTPRAWINVLQSVTDTELQHVVLDVDGSRSAEDPAGNDLAVVVSTRLGYAPDVPAVLEAIMEQLR